jgi:NTE family protein
MRRMTGFAKKLLPPLAAVLAAMPGLTGAQTPAPQPAQPPKQVQPQAQPRTGARPQTAAQPEPKRPRVGLVLGGGGARGAAHIGVLEVLEEMNVPIDCIAGTSMGALVGGAYASGRSPASMTERIQRTDWTGIFIDDPDRADVKLRRKQLLDMTIPGLEIGVSRDGTSFRSGAVGGDKIKLFINELVGADRGERLIQHLPLPISIVATDIGTGERIVMREGSLAQAMRASMSVPGVMVPVSIGKRKLVDGGLVDNLPVSEVRERCAADVVIAVDVGTPLLRAEEVTGLLSVTVQMVNILTNQNVTASLASLNPEDVLIRPDLGDVTAADFNLHAKAIEIGRKAARDAAPRLQALALKRHEYDYQTAELRTRQPPPVAVDEVRVAELKRVNPDVVRKHVDVEVGEPLNTERLNQSIVRLNGEGDFQSIDYSLEQDQASGKRVLKIAPIEKPWGPDYLRFGLNFSADFRDKAPFNLRAVYQRTWLNPLGAEWLSIVQMGERNLLSTEWYQPLDSRQVWFVQPSALAGRRTQGLWLDGDRVADFDVVEKRVALEFGANLGAAGQVRAGWLERRFRANTLTGLSVFDGTRAHAGGPTVSLDIDTLDQSYFPTRGLAVKANWVDVRRSSEDDPVYGRASVRVNHARTWRDYTIEVSGEAGASTKGVLPVYDAFTLGGPFRLSGFAQDQLLGDDLRFVRMGLQKRLVAPSSLLGASLYAGMSLEGGKLGQRFTETRLDGWLTSYGLYLGLNTFAGPLYFGYANGRHGRATWYLFLGTP